MGVHAIILDLEHVNRVSSLGDSTGRNRRPMVQLSMALVDVLPPNGSSRWICLYIMMIV
jgi:hypothetical protein